MRRTREDETNKVEEQEKFSTHTHTHKIQTRKRQALTLAPCCNHLICFVPIYLTLSSQWEPLGAMLGPSSPPCLLLLPLPLKSCTEMYTALMFALYPTCKAIISHPSWQSQALSLLHLQLFALGYDMTVRLISSLLHIAPCVSPFFFSSQTTLCAWIQPWFDKLENILPLSPCDTSAALICLALLKETHATVRHKVGADVWQTLALRVALWCDVVFLSIVAGTSEKKTALIEKGQ